MGELKTKNKDKILSLFCEDADITTRTFKVGKKNLTLYYIDCLINKELFASGIIGAINNMSASLKEFGTYSLTDKLMKEVISVATVKKTLDNKQIQEDLCAGAVIVQVKGEKNILSIMAPGYTKRSITEPPTSNVVRGPREGFIEDLDTNLSLLRRRLKTPSLAVKRLKMGERTGTNIALVYLNGVVNPYIVHKIEKRLNATKIDGIIDSNYIEEILEQGDGYFYRKLGYCEKPDIVVSKILEGRVAIVVDGSPIVLTAPFILFEDLQDSSDYYDIPTKASALRILRLLGLIVSVLLPGMYVALQSYHYRVLSINFLISLLTSIEGISFPPILEILFVLFIFETLHEASLRMPKQLGMALSIIGALVLGETAVQAGIITPPSIVVVAISGITLYIVPNQSSESSLLRTLFTLIGGVAGFYGLFLGFMFLTSYLVSLESFNAPYMSPYAPNIFSDKADGFIKKPITQIIYRPKSFKTLNSIRQQPINKELNVRQTNKKQIIKSYNKKSQEKTNGNN